MTLRKSLLRPSWLPLGAALVAVAIPAAAQRAPLFKSEILPILEKNCIKCHSGDQRMAGLDLTSFAGMMQGSSSGPVIAPGKPDRSLLMQLVEKDQMPVGGKLTAAEKQTLRAYIEQGRFPASGTEPPEVVEARDKAKIKPEDRKWWSFTKPVKPAVPAVKDASAVSTPVDNFVEAKLEEKGWKMQPVAERATLIRRAYLDLTGMPPSPADVKAFIEDKSPNAYEKVLDNLMASPHYGEQWGRHWLDIAGYADTTGNAGDSEREVAWKYRDYVIQAMNKNKPINRFILEQMAGDQLVNYQFPNQPKPEEIEPLVATGFLRMTADISDNQTIYEVDKYFDAQQKAMETSLHSLLGITIQCARCHDHKFDPILQRDYYRLMAIYTAVWDPDNWLASVLGAGPWPSRTVLNMPGEERTQWIRDVSSNDAKALRKQDDFIEATYQKFRAELKAGRDISNADLRAQMRKDIENDPDLEVDRNAPKDFISDQELEKRFPELLKWKDEIQVLRNSRRNQTAIKPDYIQAAFDVSKTPTATYILQRGNYLAPGMEVQPGIPFVLDNPDRALEFPDPMKHPEWNSTNRRLILAKWMVSPDNPLVSRVFVNHVWDWHFGEGIVRSVDDFGTQGSKPTHPEMLDYLAVSFQEHNWDLKWLNKQIMMSHAYMQRSTEIKDYVAADPSDKLLWRKAPLRLEAETIRDSMLAVSGLFNDRMFGPQVPIKRGADGQWLEVDTNGNGNRRSMYLSQTRTHPVAFLHVFDAPDMTSDNQPERFRAALPTQSLAMMNNPLVMKTTKAFAERVLEQSKGDYDQAVKLAYDQTYNRQPNEKEIALAQRAVKSEPDPKEGLRLFIQAMFGANEFLYSF